MAPKLARSVACSLFLRPATGGRRDRHRNAHRNRHTHTKTDSVRPTHDVIRRWIHIQCVPLCLRAAIGAQREAAACSSPFWRCHFGGFYILDLAFYFAQKAQQAIIFWPSVCVCVLVALMCRVSAIYHDFSSLAMISIISRSINKTQRPSRASFGGFPLQWGLLVRLSSFSSRRRRQSMEHRLPLGQCSSQLAASCALGPPPCGAVAAAPREQRRAPVAGARLRAAALRMRGGGQRRSKNCHCLKNRPAHILPPQAGTHGAFSIHSP